MTVKHDRRFALADSLSTIAQSVANDPKVRAAISDAAAAGLAAMLQARPRRVELRHHFDPLVDPENWPYAVLGLDPNATSEEVEAQYREAARLAHPDLGGSETFMRVLNLARDEIRARARP